MRINTLLGGIAVVVTIVLFLFFLLLTVHPVTPVQSGVVEWLATSSGVLPFGPAGLAHMLDVRIVIDFFRVLFVAFLLLAILSWERREKDTLRVAGTILIGVPVVLALLPWDAVFVGLHTILFPQGGWSFPIGARIIETYPMPFFIGYASALGGLAIGCGTLLWQYPR